MWIADQIVVHVLHHANFSFIFCLFQLHGEIIAQLDGEKEANSCLLLTHNTWDACRGTGFQEPQQSKNLWSELRKKVERC